MFLERRKLSGKILLLEVIPVQCLACEAFLKLFLLAVRKNGLRLFPAPMAGGDGAALQASENPSKQRAMWKISADTGGTFTDCLAEDPEGRLTRVKVLSSGALRGKIVDVAEDGKSLRVAQSWGAPDDFVRGFSFSTPALAAALTVAGFEARASRLHLSEPLPPGNWAGEPFFVQSADEAPVLAARLATGTPAGRDLPPLSMRLATTRATNALLEGKGAKTAFFVTAGFGDLLRIGTQQRPDIFALQIERPDPLHADVVEVEERLDATGGVLRPLDLNTLKKPADALLAAGIEVAAVAFMHSYRNPVHEKRVRDYLLEKGFAFVSCSHDLAPLIKILPRAETTVVDACLSPIMNSYLNRVEQAAGSRLRVMTSAGGLVTRETFRSRDSLLSGPAGGVVGAVAAGRQAGFERIIPFDMGGTSTDVSRFDGDFEYAFEQRVGTAHLLAPSLKIETVASGGGSICSFDGDRLRVGPESAGASPGPACYGGGGPLALTDAHVLLGRIDASRFGIPMFADAARRRLEELRARIEKAGQEVPGNKDLLTGFLTIANERMAEAIRRISIREGYDPSEYAMVAFGGAGGLHACAVSQLLGIRFILWPGDAGLLSADGLRQAVAERFSQMQVLVPLKECAGEIEGWIKQLAAEASLNLQREEEVSPEEVVVRRCLVDLRLSGQESSISLEYEDGKLPERFEARYREIFGYFPPGREIEVTSIRVVVSTRPPVGKTETFVRNEVRGVARAEEAAWPLLARDTLRPGDTVEGPVVIQDRFSTFVVEEGWDAVVGSAGTVRAEVRRGSSHEGRRPEHEEEARAEVVQLELYTNRLRGIAEEMGVQLQRTALSTNIKERLDFSCAILDEKGYLVVNAPHVPVHLGAMGLCVREVLKQHRFRPGDMILTNHPGIGGSHLPDLTVIAPVFVEEALIGFVANRAHHAEMGGVRPGSMPPGARSLVEEGVVLSPTLLFDQGEPRYEKVAEVLAGAPWPSRAVNDNLTDLQAQAAANLRGADALVQLARAGGTDSLRYYLKRLKALSASAADRFLETVSDEPRHARQELDDGFAIEVSLRREGGRLVFDFSGTSGEHPGSFNATPAIVHSAVIYVIRLLLGEPVPLNEGLMERIEIRLPPGLLNPTFPANPEACPAVVAGNVETSQRLVDTLLLAFDAAACSQGTMNNFVFGNEGHSFYETICGGAGAGSGFAGTSAVHTHMTNTAITDPEVLEFRYPVRLERFAIRRGSGGTGQFRGGDGVIREVVFGKGMAVSLLTQHRVQAPYGSHGGNDGAVGRQFLIRKNGTRVDLGPSAEVDVEPGDHLVIETPGGGGWGSV